MELSIVVLAWDQLHHTRRCVRSIRDNTDVPYELILVDNGSEQVAAEFAEGAADKAVLNPRNLGFAAGMNRGLDVADGRYVAFVNNDTVLPGGWASKLVDTLRTRDGVGVVVPAVTAAGDRRTVRSAPGDSVEVLPPFGIAPSAVLYLMETSVVRDIGGWDERFGIAASEDTDLCLRLWVNDLDAVFDQRVLVEHVSKGTAKDKLDDWRGQWQRNREILFEKWADPTDVLRLESCPPEVFERNLDVARSVVAWMQRYFEIRDRYYALRDDPRNLFRTLVRRIRERWS